MLLAAAAACSSRLSPEAVSWRAQAPVVGAAQSPPDATGDGVLVVETDRDQTQNGGGYYYSVRRPYEIYGVDGQLVARVQNQGLRQGEDPERISIPPGRYVVVSMYGTVYRRIQVEIRPGAKTAVSESELHNAAMVFPETGQ